MTAKRKHKRNSALERKPAKEPWEIADLPTKQKSTIRKSLKRFYQLEAREIKTGAPLTGRLVTQTNQAIAAEQSRIIDKVATLLYPELRNQGAAGLGQAHAKAIEFIGESEKWAQEVETGAML